MIDLQGALYFIRFLFFFFFRNCKQGSRTESKIWYILSELLRVDLNVLNSNEGDSFVRHAVASLRALIKSFREQDSRFSLAKAHCTLHM